MHWIRYSAYRGYQALRSGGQRNGRDESAAKVPFFGDSRSDTQPRLTCGELHARIVPDRTLHQSIGDGSPTAWNGNHRSVRCYSVAMTTRDMRNTEVTEGIAASAMQWHILGSCWLATPDAGRYIVFRLYDKYSHLVFDIHSCAGYHGHCYGERHSLDPAVVFCSSFPNWRIRRPLRSRSLYVSCFEALRSNQR